MQMIFDVKGELYDGLVTVEALKSRGGLDLTFISLDVMNRGEERVLVKGDLERLNVKDQLREFLSYKSQHTRP